MKKIVTVLSIVNLGLTSAAIAQQVRVKPACKDDYNNAMVTFNARKAEVAMKKKAQAESLKRVSDALAKAKKALSSDDGKSLLADWKSNKISADFAIKQINRELLSISGPFNNDPETLVFPNESGSTYTSHTGKNFSSMTVDGQGVLEIVEKTHRETPGFNFQECVANENRNRPLFYDCVDNRVQTWKDSDDDAKEHCYGMMSRVSAIAEGTCSKRQYAIVSKVTARVALNDGLTKSVRWPTDKELRDDSVIYAYDGRGTIDPGTPIVESQYLNLNKFMRATLRAGCFY